MKKFFKFIPLAMIICACAIVGVACGGGDDGGKEETLSAEQIRNYISTYSIDKSKCMNLPNGDCLQFSGGDDALLYLYTTNSNTSSYVSYLIKQQDGSYVESKTRPEGKIYARDSVFGNGADFPLTGYFYREINLNENSLSNDETYYYNPESAGFTVYSDVTFFASDKYYKEVNGEYVEITIPDHTYLIRTDYYNQTNNPFIAENEYYVFDGQNGYVFVDTSEGFEKGVQYYDAQHSPVGSFEEHITYYESVDGVVYTEHTGKFQAGVNYFMYEPQYSSFDNSIFEKGKTYYYYDSNSELQGSELFPNETTYYVQNYEYDEFIVKDFKPYIETYYTKIDGKYYFARRYFETREENTKYYGAEKYEVTKEEKDRAIDGIINYYKQQFSLFVTEDLVNKAKVIDLYGNDAYYYNISGTKQGDDIKITIKFPIILESETFRDIVHEFSTLSVTLKNVLAEERIEFELKSNGSFSSLSSQSHLLESFNNFSSADYDFNQIYMMDNQFVNLRATDAKTASSLNAENEITIKFSGTQIPDKTATAFNNITITEVPEANEHYTFAGWYFDGDFNFKAPSTFKLGTSTNTVYLYPKYISKHNVTVNLNGGVLYGTLPENAIKVKDYQGVQVAKTGYEFEGLYTSSNFDASSRVDSSRDEIIDSDITLYANFSKLVKVTLNTDNGKNAGVIFADAGTQLYPNYVKLPATLYKSGKIFEGWYTSPTFEEGTKIAKTSETINNNPQQAFYVPVVDEDITVYARYLDAITIHIHPSNLGDNLSTIVKEVKIARNGEFNSLVNSLNSSSYAMDYDSFSATNQYFMFVGFCTDSALTTFISSYPADGTHLYPKHITNFKFYIQCDQPLNSTSNPAEVKLVDNSVDKLEFASYYITFGAHKSARAVKLQIENSITPFLTGYNLQGIYMDPEKTISITHETNGFDWYDAIENSSITLYAKLTPQT